MKRLILVLSVFAMLLSLLVGCSGKENYSDYPFVNIRWTRTTDSDTEFIYFSGKGEFSYYCACGNPVNDSDLCDGFSYNIKTKTITLKYTEKTSDTITKLIVKKVNEDELVLDFDGEVRTFLKEKEKNEVDSVSYNGKKYLLLNYNSDIFTYDLAFSIDYSEDEIYPIEKGKWDTVYYNGSLFVIESHIEEANAYYSDDQNYSWSVTVETHSLDKEYTIDITLSDLERDYIYNIENIKKNETIFFEEIDKFAVLTKSSEDGLIAAKTEFVFKNGNWYWRSEIIDEGTEGWPEFIYKLPQTLCDKISSSEK